MSSVVRKAGREAQAVTMEAGRKTARMGLAVLAGIAVCLMLLATLPKTPGEVEALSAPEAVVSK